jgi:hypothetical protein
MVWWEYLLLALLTATAVSVVWQTWHQMRWQTWHQMRCPACRAARQAVRRWHPDWQVSDASHRASEAVRDVVAVFYMPPRVRIKPTPYILVSVGRDGAAEELPDNIESPYYIRGRK